jgi:hypothetical protein
MLKCQNNNLEENFFGRGHHDLGSQKNKKSRKSWLLVKN